MSLYLQYESTPRTQHGVLIKLYPYVCCCFFIYYYYYLSVPRDIASPHVPKDSARTITAG